jgi:hypothetical protein
LFSIIERIEEYIEELGQFYEPESKKHQQPADVIEFYRFLEVELPKLKQKWILKQKRENQS